MDRNDGTDLAALHQAIVDVSAAAFPGVHFEFYREDRVNMPFGDGVGANPPRAYVLMDLPEFETSDTPDPGTEQQAMLAKFTAEVVIKSLQADSRLRARILAAQFAAFLRKQLRFQPADVLQGAIQVTGCYKDDFSPELDQFEVFRVDWQQVVWLGDGVWGPDPDMPTTPGQPLFSFVPLIGAPYEAEYQNASGEPRT